MLVCENYIFIDIFDISFNFETSEDEYFHANALYIKFFHKFSLPDVASASILFFNIILVVISFIVIVGEDAEGNIVEFVLIDASGELTETLH